MKTKEIKQSVVINATPKAVYDALMNQAKHRKFTSAAAKINAKVGGLFSCYDGYIKGINLELKPAKLIIQAWRSQEWPKEHYSIVTYKLSTLGKGKTKLQFSHAGVPSGDVKAKSSGWVSHYWEPLKKMLEG